MKKDLEMFIDLLFFSVGNVLLILLFFFGIVAPIALFISWLSGAPIQ